MHALNRDFCVHSTDKRRCLQIFELTFAIAIESQEAEKEGIKTRVRKGLNQDCRMSHMGSTLTPNDHRWVWIELVRPLVKRNRARGRHFLSGGIEHALAEWLIGRRRRAFSHALVCQLSLARAFGSHPGKGIIRYRDRTCVYGSYIARSSSSVFSSPASLRSATPVSDRTSRRVSRSFFGKRAPSCFTGEVLKICDISTTACRAILKVSCACHFGIPSMPTITRLQVSSTVLSAASQD